MNTTCSRLLSGALAIVLAATLAVAQQPPTAPDQPAPPPAVPAEQSPAPTSPAPAPAAEPAAEPPAGAPAPEVPAPAAETAKQSETGEPPLRRIDEPVTPGAEEKAAPEAAAVTTPENEARAERREHRYGGSSEFPFGDHFVPAGSRMRDAVSIFGSTSVDGEVDGDAVSVFGSTRVGPEAKVSGAAVAVLGRLAVEGEVDDEAVGVLGGVTINGRVRGEVVSVFGDLELGPKAVVGGDIVVVGGQLIKAPEAEVRGNVVNVPILGGFGDLDWLVTWFKRCLLMGRPLAFGANLGWAWGVAASFLAFYVLLALIFPRGIEKCIATFETRPGYSILASVLTVFLTPVALVLLAVTVIGAVLVPFVGAGLLGAKLFGKAVMLAWLGRRFTRLFGNSAFSHPAIAVLVGGVLVMLLYTVPVFGFLLYKLLTWLGVGVAIYTIALSMQREKPAVRAAGAAARTTIPPVSGPAPAATPAARPVPPVADDLVPPMATIPPQTGPMPSGPAPGAAGVSSFGAAADFAAPPPQVPPLEAPAISVATMPRAGFMIRMGALLLDVVLVALMLALLNSLLPRFMHPHPPAVLLVLAIYGAVMWKLRGTTIGGIVCGLKVVRVDDRPIDWATAVVRALSCFLSLVVAGLGFIWVAIDDDKQSWHDKIAGTTVVRVPKGVSLL